MITGYFSEILKRTSSGQSIFEVLEDFERSGSFQLPELGRFLQVFLLRPVSELRSQGLKSDNIWSFSKIPRLLKFHAPKAKSTSSRLEDFPPWMTSEWISDFGKKTAHYLGRTLGREAPLSLRVSNALSVEKLSRLLISRASVPIEITRSPLSPVGLLLHGYAKPLGLRAHTRLHDMAHLFLFSEGKFEMQDDASQIVALFSLDPKKYGRLLRSHPGKAAWKKKQIRSLTISSNKPIVILDVCAGTGGKILALADLLGGKGRFFAADVSNDRLQIFEKRKRRTKKGFIKTILLDSDSGGKNQALDELTQKSDIVLIDAPCSGLGVLRRNPYKKWQLKPKELPYFSKLQSSLLDRYCRYVKPRGRLIYSVCTFRKAETVEIIDRFLKSHPDFEIEEAGYLGPGPCDGFYMASLFRRR